MNKFLVIFLTLLIMPLCKAEIIQDEVAKSLFSTIPPKTYTQYNYESLEKLPIYLQFIEDTKDETDLFEGQRLKFKVLKSVIYNGKMVIRRDSLATATVKLIITPGMNGIPASIMLDNFEFEYKPKGQTTETLEIFGQDRSLLVYPLKWALTILPPTGSLTNFIMGGHAKIKRGKIYTIYYYPEWL